MNIVAVVVVFNGARWIKKCFGSLETSSLKVKIIAVDNASSDNSVQLIKEYFPNIHLIELKENIGFGPANNIGIKKAMEANADYAFLLNQDAWIEENTIATLAQTARENPEFGVISPVHLNGSYAGLDLKFAEYIIPQRCPTFISDMYLNKLKNIYEIEFVNAAAWLISQDCLKKTGLFEPMFFLYGEDDNYLQRVEYYNFKKGIVPLVTICHDREVRTEGRNHIGSKTWSRTQSLIILLDIRKTYSTAITAFFRQKIYFLMKGILSANLKTLGWQLSEILFLATNFEKIKTSRDNLKKVPSFNL